MKVLNRNKPVNYTKIKLQRFFLCLYFFSIHFEAWDPFNTGIDYLITKMTVVFYLLFSLYSIRGFKNLTKYKKYIWSVWIIFFIQTLSGVFYKRPGFTEYFSLISFLNITVFTLILLQSIKDVLVIDKALRAFALGGIVLTLFFLLGIETSYAFGGRMNIFGVNQNLLATNAAVVLLIIINTILNKGFDNKFYKFLYIVFTPILFVFLASTGSRSGFVMLIVGLAMLVYFQKFKNPITKFMSLLLGILALAGVLYYFTTNETIGGRINESMKTGDLSNRDKYWENIITLFDISPAFGIGHTGYAYETIQIFGNYTSSHNAFLEVLIMGGAVSLMFLLIFLIRITKKAILNKDLISLVFLVPIYSIFLVGHPFGTRVIWGLFAFIICYKINYKS